jgi:hypothetical protein
VGGSCVRALLDWHLDHFSADADAGHDDGRDALMRVQQFIARIYRDRYFPGHALSRILVIAVFVSTLSVGVQADGGIVLWQRTTGPFIVTVFTTETPLRVGQADISILVENVGDPRPVVDAEVFIELENEAGAIVSAEATHRQAQNKLLYCGLINLPEAGSWRAKIFVKEGGETGEAPGDLTVVGAQPVFFAYWKLMAFPPVIIFLFLINQWLSKRRTSSLR